MQPSAIYVMVISTTFCSNWLFTCTLAVYCDSCGSLQATVFNESLVMKLMSVSIFPACVIL